MNSDFMRKSLKVLGLVCVMAACTFIVWADETQPEELDVPFEPTHPLVVEAMLKQAQVTNNDVHFDMGCGDGRIVIMAVQKFNAKKAVGIDLDPQRIREATENAAIEGVSDRVKFIHGNILDPAIPISEANVVSIYLLNTVNLMVRPRFFRELRPGTRIVSHAFHMADWEPDKTVRHPRARGQVIYYWVIPASVGGTWRWTTATPQGEVQQSLRMGQEFQGVSGMLTFPRAEDIPIGDATISGAQFSFTATVPMSGTQVKVSYQGKVEGDTIQGTQKWQGGTYSGEYPWNPRRDAIDLTGEWELKSVEQQQNSYGTLSIENKDGKLEAAYGMGKDRRRVNLSAFYSWGTSIRFELPTEDNPVIFSGVLQNDGTGAGMITSEGWPVEQQWVARRIGGAASSEKTSATQPVTQPVEPKTNTPPVVTGPGRKWSPEMGQPMPGDEYKNPVDESVLIWIGGGDLMMGNNEGPSDEKPVHRVSVPGFWLGKYEVTNKQYANFLKVSHRDTPSNWENERLNGPNQPVVGVIWLEAKSYVDWARLRLPTEAEWEFAASGSGQFRYGTKTGEMSQELANARYPGAKGSDLATTPVGQFPPNPFGIYDLAGNAWEWTSTIFYKYPYSPADGRESKEARGMRVLRGGCWYFPYDYCRTTHRHRFASHLRYDFAGIRVAMTAPATGKASAHEEK